MQVELFSSPIKAFCGLSQSHVAKKRYFCPARHVDMQTIFREFSDFFSTGLKYRMPRTQNNIFNLKYSFAYQVCTTNKCTVFFCSLSVCTIVLKIIKKKPKTRNKTKRKTKETRRYEPHSHLSPRLYSHGRMTCCAIKSQINVFKCVTREPKVQKERLN